MFPPIKQTLSIQQFHNNSMPYFDENKKRKVNTLLFYSFNVA